MACHGVGIHGTETRWTAMVAHTDSANLPISILLGTMDAPRYPAPCPSGYGL